jgi:hypothetical protein
MTGKATRTDGHVALARVRVSHSTEWVCLTRASVRVTHERVDGTSESKEEKSYF